MKGSCLSDRARIERKYCKIRNCSMEDFKGESSVERTRQKAALKVEQCLERVVGLMSTKVGLKQGGSVKPIGPEALITERTGETNTEFLLFFYFIKRVSAQLEPAIASSNVPENPAIAPCIWKITLKKRTLITISIIELLKNRCSLCWNVSNSKFATDVFLFLEDTVLERTRRPLLASAICGRVTIRSSTLFLPSILIY